MRVNNEKIDLSHLSEGQIFKSFTELYFTVMGKKFGGGKRNKQSAEACFAQYFQYDHLCNTDPSVKSKRQLIIIKLYDTPLKRQENRGKHGIYSDDLKPLIFTHPEFQGKTYRLYNELGVMRKYFQYLTGSTNVLKHRSKMEKEEFNPWTATEAGSQAYMRNAWNHARGTLERTLTSLQDAGLVTWTYYHQLIPAAVIDINETQYSRFKSGREIHTDLSKKELFWAEIRDDPNCIITRETLNSLNIYTDEWAGDLSYDDYKLLLILDKIKTYPMRASAIQEEAIYELELFMRQLTIKKYHKMKAYPSLDEIPNDYDFFRNPRLRSLYYKLTEDYYPWLVGCKVIWKELSYQVTGTKDQINQYLGYDLNTIDPVEYADKLSIEYIKYMDRHMDTFQFEPGTSQDSLVKPAFGRILNVGSRPLCESRSATQLHDKLKSLYSL